MKLSEGISIGRASGARTMGEVARLMSKYYSERPEYGLFPTDESWKEWCDDYDAWRLAYEQTFKRDFDDCKI